MSDAKPIRPPNDRHGRTHTLKVSDITMEVTVNRGTDGQIVEVFCKARGTGDKPCDGIQGHLDRGCTFMSLGFQGRGDVATVIRHLRGDQTHPRGHVGQATSVWAAIGKVLEQEIDAK